MLEHLVPRPTAMPPPGGATGAYHDRLRRVDRAPRATTVVATIILAALGILTALTLIATMPAAIAAPTAVLFIGSLIAGSLVLRERTGRLRRAHHARVPSHHVARRVEGAELRAWRRRESARREVEPYERRDDDPAWEAAGRSGSSGIRRARAPPYAASSGFTSRRRHRAERRSAPCSALLTNHPDRRHR